MTTKIKKQRIEMAQKAYGTVMDMGMILRTSRLASGLKVDYISKCMDSTQKDWVEYEHNRKPIPGHIIIKLMIFGMEFWARNKQCFDGTATTTPPVTFGAAAPTTPAKGILTNQKSDIRNQK